MLTDSKVRTAKVKKQTKLFDGGGLYLLVTPKGGKCWRLKFRFMGAEQTLALGVYPDVSLSEAREKRAEARKLLSQGIDPRSQKKVVKKDDHCVFETVAREWYKEFSKPWSEKTKTNTLNRLERDAFPYLKNREIQNITAPEILAILKRVQLRSLETALRLMTHMRQIYRYAIATGRADRNSVEDLRGALPSIKYTHYAAPVDPAKVKPLLRAIDGYDGSFVVKSAMQLAPLLFLRPGELRQGEWSEINWIAAQWEIPAERMKMKEPHIVPLSKQALVILQELYKLTGNSKYMFPSQRSLQRCMSDNAVNAALRRMGFEKEEITGHGFRAMARTILDEVLEFPADIIEHQLAHAVRGPLGRAYNRTTKIRQRKAMMQAWSDYLQELKGMEGNTVNLCAN